MSDPALWSDLAWLDARLAAAVKAADEAYGREAAGDRFRGLHIGAAEVSGLLARDAGVPVLGVEAAEPERRLASSPPMAWLADVLGLDDFDRAIVLVALAPEVDLRYERLYAYLQDDVTRRRPSVDLALNLLCATKEEKLARRAHFAADAPLLRNDVLRLIADASQAEPPMLAQAMKLDDQIVRLLLEDDGLDARLAGVAQLLQPSDDEPGLDPAMARDLTALGTRHRASGSPLKLHMHGPDPDRRQRAAGVVAVAAHMDLLRVDLTSLPTAEAAEAAVPLALREAWFRDAVLCLHGAERLWDRDRDAWPRLLNAVARHRGIVVLSSAKPLAGRPQAGGGESIGLVSLSVPAPGEEERRICWQGGLRNAGLDVTAAAVETLADRFRLTTGQITEAAAVTAATAFLREGHDGDSAGPIPDLFAAAREHSAWDVQGLVRRVTPRRSWDELVVPEDTLAQLRELCQRAAHSRRVLREWGFDGKLSLGRGATALFSGPSGTGKTMAAEVIACELGLDLYKVDLSGVVSKWIGETEKNLDRVFRAAEGGSGVLFFDEADALFGKRSEVRDSHDRYANVEISYLLQRMEEHEGIAILATNLRANLDDAFIRRLSFLVHFPFPDEVSRFGIWQRIWPGATPVGDLDLARLARELALTGGHIRNVALAAAYLAAADGGVVRMEHIARAVRREFQKMGKSPASLVATTPISSAVGSGDGIAGPQSALERA